LASTEAENGFLIQTKPEQDIWYIPEQNQKEITAVCHPGAQERLTLGY